MKPKLYVAIQTLFLVLLVGSMTVATSYIAEVLVRKAVYAWLEPNYTIYLTELSDSEQQSAQAEVQQFSVDHPLTAMVLEKQQTLQDQQIYAFHTLSTATNEDALTTFNLFGTPIITSERIAKLSSESPDTYFGFGEDQTNKLDSLPSLMSGVYFKLDAYNGKHSSGEALYISDLNTQDFQSLLSAISSATGKSSESLTTRMGGSGLMSGIFGAVSVGVACDAIVLIHIMAMVHVLLAQKRLGTYLLLGWSKTSIIGKLFSAQIQSLICVPVLAKMCVPLSH